MHNGNERRYYRRIGSGLIALAVLLAVATVYVGTRKVPNALAAALLQAITLVFTIVGAYYFATASARVAAEEMVRPHVRSAFRRVQNLYAGLGRLLREIDSQLDFHVGDDKAMLSLQLIKSIVIEQASTADDALEDWRDLVPDEIQQLEQQAQKRLEARRDP